MDKNDMGSKKHHYLPEFYIKNFTDSDGKVWVFDKKIYEENHKIVVTKKTPSQICYLIEDNIIQDYDENKSRISDLPEQIYSSILDRPLSQLMSKVLDYKDTWPLETVETHNYYLYLLLLFFRNPRNRDLVHIIRSNRPPKMDMSINGLESKEEIELLDKLVQDDNFQKFERIILPYILWKRYFSAEGLGLYKEALNDLHIKRLDYTEFHKVVDQLNLIVGDNPVIVKTINKEFGLIDQYYFVVSPELIIYKWENFFHSFEAINVLNIHRSHRYVFSNKKEWLEMSVKNYYDMYSRSGFSETEFDDMIIKILENGVKFLK